MPRMDLMCFLILVSHNPSIIFSRNRFEEASVQKPVFLFLNAKNLDGKDVKFYDQWRAWRYQLCGRKQQP
ncbi:hypothetical protein PHMEG_00016086 [Phytophthora megakarya]|uniref:Uncharacterized protein n=1 Tax=Phytophthora megakarya TaxID=4795 RepID=A0A225VZU5_9STRA|nr:hypothetical protein PHMEG_00016086 [Phytophthora megakarya]